MILNKKRWFKTQVLEFEIDYNAYPIYPDNYRIMYYVCGEHLQRAPYLTTYADTSFKPTAIKEIITYFRSLSVEDAFFKARSIARKHKKEKKQCSISVSYTTVKQRDKKLKELL